MCGFLVRLEKYENTEEKRTKEESTNSSHRCYAKKKRRQKMRRKKKEAEMEEEEEEMQNEEPEDRTGRLSGLGVFLLGIALLCVILYLASLLLTNPAGTFWLLSQIPPTAPQPLIITPDLTIYSTEDPFQLKIVVGGGILIALLLVMGSIGGRITKHGLEMYGTPSLKKVDRKFKLILKRLKQISPQVRAEAQ